MIAVAVNAAALSPLLQCCIHGGPSSPAAELVAVACNSEELKPSIQNNTREQAPAPGDVQLLLDGETFRRGEGEGSHISIVDISLTDIAHQQLSERVIRSSGDHFFFSWSTSCRIALSTPEHVADVSTRVA